jgi:hypothetical protein
MGNISPALVGKAGELLVAAELMRRGVEVAHPASDVGVDLLAYSLRPGEAVARSFIPIQVKAHSGMGYSFQKAWFKRSSGIMLVLVWHVQTTPEFYVFKDVDAVEKALGPVYTASKSWTPNGAYRITDPSQEALGRLRPYLNGWDVITRLILT